MKTKEEILAKIDELTDDFSKWSREIDLGGEWGGTADDYCPEKASDTLLEFASWLTGEEISYPAPEPEPKTDGYWTPNIMGLHSVFHCRCVMITPPKEETTPPQ